jgi:hypothetical protein
MSLTTPPSAPVAADSRSTFKTKAFAFVAWFITFVTEMNAEILTILGYKTTAQDAATNSAASAAAAAAAASAAAWNVGTAYSANQCAISQVNFQTYRANAAVTGGLDPALSLAGVWVNVSQPPVTVTDCSGSVTAVAGGRYRFTGAGDLTLPIAPIRGNTVRVCKTGSHTVTVLRNGKPIGSTADDATLGSQDVWYELMYLDVTVGWALVTY